MERDLYHIGYNLRSSIAETLPSNKFIIFLRGYFDKRGNINKKTIINTELECSFICDKIIYDLFTKLDYSFSASSKNTENIITLTNYNALDFLNDIYKNADGRYRNNTKYSIYISWLTYGVINYNFVKVDDNGIIPYKKSSEIGFNITIISLVEKIGKDIFIYDTGIKAIPDFGYYIKLIAKNNLIKNGYILASNTIENIDDTIKISLVKIDDTLPELLIPFVGCQLIFDKIF
jgi:hypothetical protein